MISPALKTLLHSITPTLVLSVSPIASGGDGVNITQFGAYKNGCDTTPVLRAALEHCRKTQAPKLSFPPGRYDFWPDLAQEEYLFISNNDEGLKRIAFDLTGMKGFEIDGQGAQFVFHGFVCPFYIANASGITLRNFSIDFQRTFNSEGKVLKLVEGGVDVEIPEEFPYSVRNGLLVFTDGKKGVEPQTTVKGREVVYPYGQLLEFDAKRRETAYKAQDYYIKGGVAVKEIGPRQVRLFVPGIQATPGNILVFGPDHRDVPAFTISDSVGIKLDHVEIYHCGGMGVIVQRSRDIELDTVKVTPTPGSQRMVSATADATHFVNCRGKIVLRNCLFENQVDDATNVHGIYARIARRLGPSEIELQLVHPQQFGFDFVTPGVRLELVHKASMITYGEAGVKSVDRQNGEVTRVVFNEALPEELMEGDVMASLEANTAEVVIEGCTIRNNRARGILLGSRGKMTIENNTFHTPGAAILFEGDARFWFEQAGVRHCVIRHNRFEDCNFGVWGTACIEVGAGIERQERENSRYNRNIVIEENLFRVLGGERIVSAYSVDGLTFRHNRIETSTDYPAGAAVAKLFDISHCDQVTVETTPEAAAVSSR